MGTFERAKAKVLTEIRNEGWDSVSKQDLECTYSVAMKGYYTSCGKRMAVAYFVPSRGDKAVLGTLEAVYTDCGNNVLKYTKCKICKKSKLKEEINNFSKEVDKLISETNTYKTLNGNNEGKY